MPPPWPFAMVGGPFGAGVPFGPLLPGRAGWPKGPRLGWSGDELRLLPRSSTLGEACTDWTNGGGPVTTVVAVVRSSSTSMSAVAKAAGSTPCGPINGLCSILFRATRRQSLKRQPARSRYNDLLLRFLILLLFFHLPSVPSLPRGRREVWAQPCRAPEKKGTRSRRLYHTYATLLRYSEYYYYSPGV